jgi:hypothetical protein|tara:strand:- start:1496 stop:1801 length:306 start_codon:yes stop_codon:yes gene_type:complete
MEIPKYTMVEKEDVDYFGFKIQEGEYKDVVYFYGEVKIEENEEEDNAVLNFNYKIDNGNEQYSIEELEDSVKFNDLMGDILATILDTENTENDKGLTDDNS